MKRIKFQSLRHLRTADENAQLRRIGEKIKRRLKRIFEAEAARRDCGHFFRYRFLK
jgi:hypothetical protein